MAPLPLFSDRPRPCPWCGATLGVVHVHGHDQCLFCKTNIDPCCSGDHGNDAVTRAQSLRPVNTAPRLFPMVFDTLGGPDVSVTTDALLFALSNRLASDYDEARLVLEAAERAGIVRTDPPGMHRLATVQIPPPSGRG